MSDPLWRELEGYLPADSVQIELPRRWWEWLLKRPARTIHYTAYSTVLNPHDD